MPIKICHYIFYLEYQINN